MFCDEIFLGQKIPHFCPPEVNLMHRNRKPFPSSFFSHNFSSPLQAANLSASPISNEIFNLPILGNISERYVSFKICFLIQGP
jgi:hypothetical protein